VGTIAANDRLLCNLKQPNAGHPCLGVVNVLGIESRFVFAEDQMCATVDLFHGTVEAGAAAGVAGRVMAGNGHLQPDRILVAICQNFADLLEIAGGFALLPEFAPRAAVIVRDAGLDRQGKGLLASKRGVKSVTVSQFALSLDGGANVIGMSA
jgi:hypothetical protein